MVIKNKEINLDILKLLNQLLHVEYFIEIFSVQK